MFSFRPAIASLFALLLCGAGSALAQSDSEARNPFNLYGQPGRGALESDGGRKMSFEELKTRPVHHAPPDVMAKAEQLHAAQNFQGALDLLSPYQGGLDITRWLEQKARAGAILYMWELSDRLAASDPADSVFWAYAALIGTWQEAAICVDSATELSAETLSKRYPRSLDARRANPWRVKESIAKAFALHRSLQDRKAYPNPVHWLCRPFGNPQRSARAPVSYDQRYWNVLRVQSRNRIRTRLGLPAAQREPVPKPDALT